MADNNGGTSSHSVITEETAVSRYNLWVSLNLIYQRLQNMQLLSEH